MKGRLAIPTVALFLGLFVVAPAQASFEQVNTFGQDPVEYPGGQLKKGSQVYFGKATAVNISGAGGVAPGTIYAVASHANSVAVYTAKGEFLQAWGYGVGDEAAAFEHCGPQGEPAFPTCVAPADLFIRGPGGSSEAIGGLADPIGIAVDQSTGNVYVLNSNRKQGVVQVFNADGTELLGGFGDFVEDKLDKSEIVEESQEKFHLLGESIAVDSSGRVYVPDRDRAVTPPPHISRTMVFEPESPGDYEHYAYTGRANDIEVGGGLVAVDDAGNLYRANEEKIWELAAADHHVLCEFKVKGSGLSAMTVDPASGEPYYYSYKDEEVHRLGACSDGAFGAEIEKFGASSTLTSPSFSEMQGLSFNPALVYDGERPPGALYILQPKGLNEKHELGGLGIVFARAEVHAPEVDSEAVLEIGTTTAVPQARINPKGSPTRYSFQYISDAAFQENEPAERFAGAGEAPPEGAELEAGLAPVPVSAVVEDLQPNTEYHYRVVAESCAEGEEPALCTTVGEAHVFRTFAAEAPGAPDHRAFELVSPVEKSGGEVYPAEPFVATPSCIECKPGAYSVRFPELSSPEGDRVVYDGDPFSFTEGGKSVNEYLSHRTASGWQTRSLTPLLQAEGQESGHRGFSRDLNRGVLIQKGGASLAPSAPGGAEGAFSEIFTQASAEPAALTSLLSEAAPNEGGRLKIVYAGGSTDLGHVFFSAEDALTGETPFAPAASYEFDKDNLYEYVDGELRLVNVLPGNVAAALNAGFGAGTETNLSHAISDDGSRAFWSAPGGQVYVREDGQTTREIPASGKFLTASADGSKVLLDSGELYDLEAESSLDLTAGKGGFQGIAGQSEDLSRIYFADTAVLDETPNDQGDVAEAGQDNLYAWHEGATSFIAVLGGLEEETADWRPSPVVRTAEASPDGRWLAFRSVEPLTGYDNHGPCQHVPNSEKFEVAPCIQVFLYEVESGELRCPSCASTGEAPRGHSRLVVLTHAEASQLQPAYLTDEGRLYFDSPNRLSPEDSNGAIEDVYEFEPEGIGTCEHAEGCVSLVSSGHGSYDANLLIVDETGKNVFFTSRDQLALKDRDELIDLYDAREGGGIASESESLRAECQGEACQPAAIAPNDPTPSSAGLQAEGNVKRGGGAKPRCPKGKRRLARKGGARCVRRKRQQKHAAAHNRTANHNRGGAK